MTDEERDTQETCASKLLHKLRLIEKHEMLLAQKRKEVLDALEGLDRQGWDWVTVREAAAFLKVSQPTVYGLIDRKRLEVRHIGGKKFLRMSELKRIDDKYNPVIPQVYIKRQLRAKEV